ncbi:MAG TPA: trypsin-like peptidase domain-containing protein [Candidatus Hydrogenedentes bacterium]|mgnify:CR=1 FL=1|nr:trypsin-like peptidase domain-containing protein [Candidatus Hydrogenedentota bacterium]HPJ99499.1 trypsin-like peptidase domain-containing protein [Candidatus Hydrogenedentota bacterium]
MHRALVLCSVMAWIAAAPVSAQDGVDQSRRNALVQAIEKAAPAVVSINVLETQADIPPLFRDFYEFFDLQPPRRRVENRRIDSVGSGFIIDREGHILTNYHVVEDASGIASVTLPDGRDLTASIVGVDPRTDLALLKAEGTDLPFTVLGESDDLYIGEWVIAIGNPFGPLISDPQPTVSVGVVSAKNRRLSPSVGKGARLYQNMIQTDAAINPGNSGGPLVNARGQAIGVNTMIFSQSGGSVGLGFAIPISRARRVVAELQRFGRRRDPWAGFKVEDVAGLRPGVARQHGITSDHGCLVVNILRDCPAYAAGLRPGDIIVGIAGQEVMRSSDIDFAIWGHFVGDAISIDIDRQGERQSLTFVLEELSR